MTTNTRKPLCDQPSLPCTFVDSILAPGLRTTGEIARIPCHQRASNLLAKRSCHFRPCKAPNRESSPSAYTCFCGDVRVICDHMCMHVVYIVETLAQSCAALACRSCEMNLHVPGPQIHIDKRFDCTCIIICITFRFPSPNIFRYDFHTHTRAHTSHKLSMKVPPPSNRTRQKHGDTHAHSRIHARLAGPRPPHEPPLNGVRPSLRGSARDVRSRLQAIQGRLQDPIFAGLPKMAVSAELAGPDRAESVVKKPATITESLSAIQGRVGSMLAEAGIDADNEAQPRSLSAEDLERMLASGMVPRPPVKHLKRQDSNSGEQHSLSAAEIDRMLYGDRSPQPPQPSGAPKWFKSTKDALSSQPSRLASRTASKGLRSVKSGRELLLDLNSINNVASRSVGSNEPSTPVRGTAVLGRSPTSGSSDVQGTIQAYIETYLHGRPAEHAQHAGPPSAVSPLSRATMTLAPSHVPRPADEAPFKRSRPLQDDLAGEQTPTRRSNTTQAADHWTSPSAASTQLRSVQARATAPAVPLQGDVGYWQAGAVSSRALQDDFGNVPTPVPRQNTGMQSPSRLHAPIIFPRTAQGAANLAALPLTIRVLGDRNGSAVTMPRPEDFALSALEQNVPTRVSRPLQDDFADDVVAPSLQQQQQAPQDSANSPKRVSIREDVQLNNS